MIADDIAARIRARVPSLVVFAHAVPVPERAPGGVIPDRYVIVQAAQPVIGSDDLATSERTRERSVWVRTVATDRSTKDDQVAVSRCAWAAERADEALAGWRYSGWLPRHDASTPARRDDDQPDRVVAYASSVWTFRTA